MIEKIQALGQEEDHEQILRKRCIYICDSTVKFATQVGCVKWHTNVTYFLLVLKLLLPVNNALVAILDTFLVSVNKPIYFGRKKIESTDKEKDHKYLSTKCLFIKYLSPKCVSVKCLQAKCFSTKSHVTRHLV
jgi:hypothetical protein